MPRAGARRPAGGRSDRPRAQDRLGQRHRRGEQRAHERVALDDPEPGGHVQAGRRDRHDAGDGQPAVLAGAQREAAAERVAGDDDVAVLRGVLDRRRGERVELAEHRARPERRGGPEAGQVERDRPPVAAGELVEHQAPRVGGVRVAVQQHERRAVALELQRAGLEARELQAVLDERLHPWP
jgi:hypothetical protein